jgi:hypothetical protein
MKPFNLQDALAGKPVITRSGHPVTQLTYFSDADIEQKLLGCESGTIERWDDQGYYQPSKRESSMDLFMAPVKQTFWFAYDIEESIGHKNVTCLNSSCFYKSRDVVESIRADRGKHWKIASIEIEV